MINECDCLGRDLFPSEAVVPQPDAEASLRRFLREHRRALISLLAVGAALSLALVVVPQAAGLGETVSRIRRGDARWLALGVALQTASIAGYVAIFNAVVSEAGARIGWRASYQITLAGTVATKLFGAAGAGGVALTAWALRAAGLESRTVVRRIAGLQVVLYSIYMAALLLVGSGLAVGLLAGSAPWSMTVLPAAFGGTVIGLALALAFVPGPLERSLERRSSTSGWIGGTLRRLAPVPRTVKEGVTAATVLFRRSDAGLIGALAYWAFDIATLWASFHAFGDPPPAAIVVMGYFVGLLANTLPLPGGIGGVEGGMIGAFLAFGVAGGLVVLAVLSYRALSFWLPTIPGTVAYVQLRRTIAGWRADDDKDAGLAPASSPAGPGKIGAEARGGADTGG